MINSRAVKNQHKTIASALLHGEVFTLDNLNLIDTTTPAKTEREKIYSFVLNEAKEHAIGTPKQDTTGLLPKPIGDSYHEFLEDDGHDPEYADEQANKIEFVCKKTFKKPKATEIAGALASGLDQDNSWLSDWAILPSGEYYNLTSATRAGLRWFNNAHFDKIPLTEKGGSQLATNYVNGKISSVDGLAYNPKYGRIFSRDGRTLANLFAEHKHTSKCDLIEARDMIESHLNFLLGDKLERDLILDWMAHQVQNPGVLVGYCPLILGTQGDGKTTIGRIVRAAIGGRNVTMIDNDSINSSFTGWANSSSTAIIEEIRASGINRFTIYDRLKSFITNVDVNITRKGFDPITVENVTNYIAFTNSPDAVPINDSDRRFYILETRHLGDKFDHIGNAEHFDRVYDCIDNNPNGIFRYLTNHKISESFKKQRTPPQSAAKQRMIENSMSSGALAIKERIEMFGEILFIGGGLSTTLLYKKDSSQFVYDLPKNKAMSFAMAELGYIKSNVRPRIGDGRSTIYHQR
jgi:hypothetical protein